MILPMVAARAPAVEAEYRYEVEQAEGELSLAVGSMLRAIYESDLRPIPVAPVEATKRTPGRP